MPPGYLGFNSPPDLSVRQYGVMAAAPAALTLRLGRIGIERRRIAGAARALDDLHFLAGGLFHGANDRAIRGRRAGTEIVEMLGARHGEPLEDGDVRAAQVVHVHIIAQA